MGNGQSRHGGRPKKSKSMPALSAASAAPSESKLSVLDVNDMPSAVEIDSEFQRLLVRFTFTLLMQEFVGVTIG
jgi:hypothetical protein